MDGDIGGITPSMREQTPEQIDRVNEYLFNKWGLKRLSDTEIDAKVSEIRSNSAYRGFPRPRLWIVKKSDTVIP